MKRFLILFSMFLVISSPVFAVGYTKIEPEFITEKQTKEYKTVNETLAVIFSRIKPLVKTGKYPKYYHDFKLVEDDGTQNKNYLYVKSGSAELIYNSDSNELKYVSFRRPELQKNRIIYDYPSGTLHAVQIFLSDKESYVFSSEGKYVDYNPYVTEVRTKVANSWQVPSRKKIDVLAKGQKDLLVQVAVTVKNDGSVKKCKILKSSKIKELDDNAIDAIKKAAPFKKFPANFFNEELVIVLNFNFSL